MYGRVAFITGGASGFGRAFTQKLLQKGCKVCFADTNTQGGSELVKDLNSQFGISEVMFVPCDVTNLNDLQSALDRAITFFGQIDIFCNNAGIIDEFNWKKMIDVNLNGVINGTNVALKHMGKNSGGQGGNIINISSLAGLYPMPFGPVYTAVKHAVVGFTRAWAGSYKQHGVRFNCICPGFSDTDMVKTQFKGKLLDDDKAMKNLKRLGLLPVEKTVEAFMMIAEDTNPELNGAIFKVRNNDGITIHKFEQISKL